MDRETFYDRSRNMHIIKAKAGERSLQMSFTQREFRDMTAEELDNNFRFLENKLAFAIKLAAEEK